MSEYRMVKEFQLEQLMKAVNIAVENKNYEELAGLTWMLDRLTKDLAQIENVA
jgi:hypothetical protein